MRRSVRRWSWMGTARLVAAFALGVTGGTAKAVAAGPLPVPLILLSRQGGDVSGEVALWQPGSGALSLEPARRILLKEGLVTPPYAWNGTTLAVDAGAYVSSSGIHVDPLALPGPTQGYLLVTAAPPEGVYVRGTSVIIRSGSAEHPHTATYANFAGIPGTSTMSQFAPLAWWHMGAARGVIVQYFRPASPGSREMVPGLLVLRVGGGRASGHEIQSPACIENLMFPQGVQAGSSFDVAAAGGGVCQVDLAARTVRLLRPVRLAGHGTFALNGGPLLGSWHGDLLVEAQSGSGETIYALSNGREIGQLTINDESGMVQLQGQAGSRSIHLPLTVAPMLPVAP